MVFFIGSIFVDENEGFLKKGIHPFLHVESMGHALHVFVNQEIQGHYLLLPRFYFSNLFFILKLEY